MIKVGTVYVGGPMRGKPLYNFAEFFKAEIALTTAGWTVINPAAIDMAKGFNPAEALDSECNSKVFNIEAALKGDFEVILARCKALVMLPGWRDSTGAKAEVVVAHFSGIKVYELVWDHTTSRGFLLKPMLDKPEVTFKVGEKYTGDITDCGFKDAGDGNVSFDLDSDDADKRAVDGATGSIPLRQKKSIDLAPRGEWDESDAEDEFAKMGDLEGP